MTKTAFRLAFLLFFLITPLRSLAYCEDFLVGINNLQVYRQVESGSTECYVSLQPRNIEGLVYRDYLITSQGLLMVFNSYGEGPSSEATGAREFYFFPRGIKSELEIKTTEAEGGFIQVQMPSGRWVTFSGETADISSLDSGSILRDPKIYKENRGGIEITSYDGLMLDAGFTIGKSPTDDLNRKSTFRDSEGRTCQLQNRLIFTKVDVNSVLKSDVEISKLLKSKCPTLRIDF